MPARPPVKRLERPSKLLSARLKTALLAMVYDGLNDNDAAIKAGLTVNAIRMALKEGHVRTWYRNELHVLRERESPTNIRRLCAIRDAANNMPAVNAIKVLEQLNEEENSYRRGGSIGSPGLVVIVEGAQARGEAAKVIENEPQAIDKERDRTY